MHKKDGLLDISPFFCCRLALLYHLFRSVAKWGGTTWYSMATTWNKNYTALLRKGYIFAADFYIFKFNSKDKKMKRFEKMMLLGLMVASSPVVSMNAMPAAFAITGQTNLVSKTPLEVPFADDGDIVFLTYHREIGDHVIHGTKRSPANYSYLPLTWIEDENLYFDGSVSISSIGVNIQNENGVEVLGTTIDVQQGYTTSIDISSLAEGSYTLYITIGELTFKAEFEY